jgi:hypothetical protein
MPMEKLRAVVIFPKFFQISSTGIFLRKLLSIKRLEQINQEVGAEVFLEENIFFIFLLLFSFKKYFPLWYFCFSYLV